MWWSGMIGRAAAEGGDRKPTRSGASNRPRPLISVYLYSRNPVNTAQQAKSSTVTPACGEEGRWSVGPLRRMDGGSRRMLL